jgi:hypothetical protein
MSLENIFYLSQTVASGAVVCSLIYLALQVRGAERAQRAIMQQGRANRASVAAFTLANPDLARIWRKGLAGDGDFTRDEFAQWMLLARALFLSGEDSFLQHKAGQLDQQAFASYVAGASFYMASPGLRAAWKLAAGQFGREFRDFVGPLVENARVDPEVDIYAAWHDLVLSEKASPSGPVGPA